MISVEEALARLLAPLAPVPPEQVSIADALGRVLAEDVAARRTQPPFAVSPRKLDVVNDYGDDRLTLTTCNPRFSASQRLIVVSRPDHPPPPAPRPKTPVRVNDTIGWHFASLLSALVWALALVALGLAYGLARRHWSRLTTLLLLSPLWACGLLLLFEQLNRMLPPNV